jgi:hypothetical protein
MSGASGGGPAKKGVHQAPTPLREFLLKVFGRTATSSNHQALGSLTFRFCEAPFGRIGNDLIRNQAS